LSGIEVRTAAATLLAAGSCAATPRQSEASSASCLNISNTRMWSAAAAAAHSPLCPAFHALIWQKLPATDTK